MENQVEIHSPPIFWRLTKFALFKNQIILYMTSWAPSILCILSLMEINL
jgi:hypothetical protein